SHREHAGGDPAVHVSHPASLLPHHRARHLPERHWTAAPVAPGRGARDLGCGGAVAGGCTQPEARRGRRAPPSFLLTRLAATVRFGRRVPLTSTFVPLLSAGQVVFLNSVAPVVVPMFPATEKVIAGQIPPSPLRAPSNSTSASSSSSSSISTVFARI